MEVIGEILEPFDIGDPMSLTSKSLTLDPWKDEFILGPFCMVFHDLDEFIDNGFDFVVMGWAANVIFWTLELIWKKFQGSMKEYEAIFF